MNSSGSGQLPFKKDLGEFGLVLHGGAGAPAKLSAAATREYIELMNISLGLGWKALHSGAHATEAVLAAVKVLEDSPLFNAGGLGVVLDCEGKARCDAGIMQGCDLSAGGVAHVGGVANPSRLAYLVMKESPAVLICGDGALKLAKEKGIEVFSDEKHFVTEERRKQLEIVKKRGESMSFDHDSETEREKMGTVGVVALDRNGNLSAVTSTGGRVNKPVGRVGDSPIPGCGVWADNQCLAVSGTGVGEAFMMAGAAKYLAQSFTHTGDIQKSLHSTLKEIQRFQGSGGLICITKDKQVAWDFDTPAMFRAYTGEDGIAHSFIFLEN